MDNIVCEKVVVDGDLSYLVQYHSESERLDRDSCLRYLRSCGHTVTCTPHAVVGPGGEPGVTWGDLSHIIETT